jgi:hypothetical protein
LLTPNQEAWLQALESDEFKQTKCNLQSVDGYCCLGVGCVVAERAGVPVNKYADFIVGKTLENQLPILAWLGLTSSIGCPTGILNDPVQRDSILTEMNDNGKSFKEIARTIRAHPEWYFDQPEPSDRDPDS